MPIRTPGDVLRTGRQTLKKTQQEVALEISRSFRTYQKWERNESRPSSFSDIAAVCRACGVPVEDYITGMQTQVYLSRDDIRIIEQMRMLNEKDRQSIYQIIDSLASLSEAAVRKELAEEADAPRN